MSESLPLTIQVLQITVKACNDGWCDLIGPYGTCHTLDILDTYRPDQDTITFDGDPIKNLDELVGRFVRTRCDLVTATLSNQRPDGDGSYHKADFRSVVTKGDS